MLRSSLLILGFFSFFSVFTQIVNIENKRIFMDTTGWSGSASASFSLIQNKQLFMQLNSKTHVQWKSKKHLVLLLNELLYSAGDQVYANTGMAHLRYNYRLFNSTWKLEKYAQVQYNQLLNQKVRALYGIGIRWKPFDNKKVRFFTGTGFFYEYEELATEQVFINTIRSSSYLSWFMNFKHFSFAGTTYFQPNMEDIKDYRISGSYLLKTKVTENVSFKTEFNIFHDEKPPKEVRKSIGSMLVGIQYDFGK